MGLFISEDAGSRLRSIAEWRKLIVPINKRGKAEWYWSSVILFLDSTCLRGNLGRNSAQLFSFSSKNRIIADSERISIICLVTSLEYRSISELEAAWDDIQT